METSVLLEAMIPLRAVLRSVSTTTGALCVMIRGTLLTPVLPADRLASQTRMPRPSQVPSLVRVLELLFLMMLLAVVVKAGS